jgi:membrane dipeptidase|tara:strand:+ start:148 stop:1449 length:1302 start_codon:yes stop_codon:yes gene_type:complete
MFKLWLKASFVLALLVGVSCGGSEPMESVADVAPSEDEIVEQARGIHERVLTIDTHDDIPFNFATEEVDPGVRGERQVDLPKMREGLLDVGYFVVFVGQTPRTPENYEKAKSDAMTKFDAIHRMTDEMYPDEIGFANTADEIESIHAAGKLVATIGIENGYVIGKDLSLVEKYHELGARYMTLAHGGHNDIADSATPRADEPESEHDGLSEFGEEVVAEMNRVGMMVDVSHISKQAMLDAVVASRAPVVGSHSSMRAINDHPRNMDDEQLLALKDNGGVIQTVALGAFVKSASPERQGAIATLREEMGIEGRNVARSLAEQELSEDEYEARLTEYETSLAQIDEQWPPANVADFVDHIDHGVNLIGIDHIGISSDFDGGGGIVGWDDASETGNVTLELVRRGYSEEEIAKLWGGNLLRVLRAAERIASEMQAE